VSTPKDWRGFDQTRLIRVLKGFVAGDQIDPVPLIALPIPELGHTPYRYRVLHGVHRFYSSIAVGFSHLPAEI
jgi:hypothetical protein